MIDDLISPGFSSMRTRQSLRPARISARTSWTQRGQSESVARGKPRTGNVRSFDLIWGAGAHAGWKLPWGSFELNHWTASHVVPATDDRLLPTRVASVMKLSWA